MAPSEVNQKEMWDLMNRLFPVHRTLIGEGFARSLDIVKERIPLDIHTVPSGEACFDWVVPKGFKVNEAYVEAPDGSRVLDFQDCHYHVWQYCKPFSGRMSREELTAATSTIPELPDAIPLRVSYYRDKFGLCMSQNQLDRLPAGDYNVHIDTEIYDDYLRIGEWHLPGESDREIIITCYLCHPHGANDNLSGVAVATELFRLISELPNRRYSYRLLIWPETLGSYAYLSHFPERIEKIAGGLVVACVGDGGPFTYKKTFHGNTEMDRAVQHALRYSGKKHVIRDYSTATGSDEFTLNGPGFRLPVGCLMRTPFAEFPEYHSSADDLNFVRPEHLFESLEIYWDVIQTLERNKTYKPHFKAPPFLTRYGVYPFDMGGGEGKLGSEQGQAYYHIMGLVDGKMDLLEIADRSELSIRMFDRAVSDFLRVRLMEEVA